MTYLREKADINVATNGKEVPNPTTYLEYGGRGSS
jgi:hypothetical protein